MKTIFSCLFSYTPNAKVFLFSRYNISNFITNKIHFIKKIQVTFLNLKLRSKHTLANNSYGKSGIKHTQTNSQTTK